MDKEEKMQSEDGQETEAETAADQPTETPESDAEQSQKDEAENGGEQESGAPPVSSSRAEDQSEKADVTAEADKEPAAQDAPGQDAAAENAENTSAGSPDTARDMELLNVKAQLAAYKCGVRGDVVEDAVCLAVRDAEKAGKVTEESVADALKGVLDRHPEWKQTHESKEDLRVGADGAKVTHSSGDEISKIFGNS